MPRSQYDQEADETCPKANRVFTDRDAIKAQFDQARAELPPDQHRLLVFYGLGQAARPRPSRCPGARW